MTVLGRAWRRFRRLPAGLQALAAVAVLAAYTVALVVILSGGEEESSGSEPLSSLEREVKTNVERGEVPQTSDTDDVSDFRAPHVTSVKCEGDGCTVVYSVAVPGRGRLTLQMVDVVRRVFGGTDVERVTLDIVRGQPTGPLASPKSEEETPLGLPLFKTTCDRSKAEANTNWRSFRDASAAFASMCKTEDLFQGGPGGASGGQGGVGGGE